MHEHSRSENLRVLGLSVSDLELARKSELVSLALRAGRKEAAVKSAAKSAAGRKNA